MHVYILSTRLENNMLWAQSTRTESISNSENETQSTWNCCKGNHWERQVSSIRGILRQKNSYSTSHINVQSSIYWPKQLNLVGTDYHSKIAASCVNSTKFGESCSDHLADFLEVYISNTVEHACISNTAQEHVEKEQTRNDTKKKWYSSPILTNEKET